MQSNDPNHVILTNTLPSRDQRGLAFGVLAEQLVDGAELHPGLEAGQGHMEGVALPRSRFTLGTLHKM